MNLAPVTAIELSALAADKNSFAIATVNGAQVNVVFQKGAKTRT